MTAPPLDDLHNRLTAKFVREVLRETIAAGGTDSSVMVLLESVVFGGLLANEKLFGVSRRATVELLNSLAQAVEERLAREANER